MDNCSAHQERDDIPLSIRDQANLLKDRRLVINNQERVEAYLRNIGYCRLKGYFPAFQDENYPFFGPAKGYFRPGTTFDDVLDLYVFDRKLRLILLEAFEKIEVALRSLWQNKMAEHHGAYAHGCACFSDVFKNFSGRKDSMPCTEFYKKKHPKKKFPDEYPIWIVVEELSFNQLADLIKITAGGNKQCPDNHEQKNQDVVRCIAAKIGTDPASVMPHLLDSLRKIRNICAHHNVLWNQVVNIGGLNSMKSPGGLLTKGSNTGKSGAPAGTGHVCNYLIIIGHMMRSLSPQTSWCNRLVNHLKTATPEQRTAMGFPDGPWHAMLEGSTVRN